MRRFAKALVLAVLFAALAATVAGASRPNRAPGVDPTYGDGGVVKVPSPAPLGESVYYYVAGSFGPAADGSTYVLSSVYGCTPACGSSEFLSRYESDGARDESFGGTGEVALPAGTHYSVITDGAGRAVVADLADNAVWIRRFTSDGTPVAGFGSEGAVRIPCHRRYPGVRLLAESGGRTLVEINTGTVRHGGVYREGAQVRLTRLRPDGTPDPSFGQAGTVTFTIYGPGEPHSVVRTAGDATLLGGSGGTGCCGQRGIYLWRVNGEGGVERRFSHAATRSLRQVKTLSSHPSLATVLPREDGTIGMIGTTNPEGHGFYLRLRGDGRPVAGFGKGGLLRLPFSVESAAAGRGGSVFALGTPAKTPYGPYRAFRVLAGGRLDPAYKGATGLKMPLRGVRIHATPLGGGRLLITDNGNFYCRSGCPSEPAMTRFLE
jgi:hypothetical protein